MGPSFINSLIIAVPGTVLPTLVAVLLLLLLLDEIPWTQYPVYLHGSSPGCAGPDDPDPVLRCMLTSDW